MFWACCQPIDFNYSITIVTDEPDGKVPARPQYSVLTNFYTVGFFFSHLGTP